MISFSVQAGVTELNGSSQAWKKISDNPTNLCLCITGIRERDTQVVDINQGIIGNPRPHFQPAEQSSIEERAPFFVLNLLKACRSEWLHFEWSLVNKSPVPVSLLLY